jgi:hypothetical protein
MRAGRTSPMPTNPTPKQLKTAPELERLILNEMRSHAICAGIAAVTVRENSAQAGTNWQVAHINARGGDVPPACRNICMSIAARLQEEFELVPEFEWDMDF